MPFDPARLFAARIGGHNAALGLDYRAHGASSRGVIARPPPTCRAPGAMPFDPARLFAARLGGHYAALGLDYRGHGSDAGGDDWVELAMPYADALVGDPSRGVVASGPILAMMDVATSAAVWLRHGRFVAHATLDLRVDYLRAATPGRTIVGRGECYRISRSVAFVRGQAHDGDPDDPVAHVAGTFMAPEGYR